MIRFLKYIFSKLTRRNNLNVNVKVTKLVIKKTIYIEEKDSTSKPSQHE